MILTVSFIPFHHTRQEILGWNSGTTCIEYGRMTLMVVTLSICGMVEQKISTVTNAGEKPKVAVAIKLDPSQYKPLDCLRSCSFLVKAINESLVWLPIIVWWVTTGYILLIIKNEYQWKLDYIKVISNTSLKTSSIYIACLSWDRKQEMARTFAMIYRYSCSRIFLWWLKTKENNSHFCSLSLACV